MATVLSLIHWLLLAAHFLLRYVLDLIFLGALDSSEFMDDKTAHQNIASAMVYLQAIQRIFVFLNPHPILASLGLLVPQTRPYILIGYSWKTSFWLIHRVTRNVPEESLWEALSALITFTRLSSGKTTSFELTETSDPSSWTPTYHLCLWLIPSLIRSAVPATILVFLFRKISLPLPTIQSTLHVVSSTSVAPQLPRGFSAIIPSCYDGDTCHTEQLLYNGQPLPDLFATLNVRLLGVDAPERRSSKCELEKCLALRAKRELEHIVGAGTGARVMLEQCRHDKYGGRILCDIQTEEDKASARTTASGVMLATGLAVPYYGKRKAFSWCDVQSMLGPDGREDNSILRRHIMACGGWESAMEDEDGDDFFVDDDGTFGEIWH